MSRILWAAIVLLTACSDGGPNDDRLFVDLIVDPVSTSFRITVEVTDWDGEYLASEVQLEVESLDGPIPLATAIPRKTGALSRQLPYCFEVTIVTAQGLVMFSFVGPVSIVWTAFMWLADTMDRDLNNVAQSKSGRLSVSCS